MASAVANPKSTEIKIPEDIENRVLGNLFGLLIVCGGLLGGTMLGERSFAYWRQDIVPLGLLAIIVFRLLGNSIDLFRTFLLEESIRSSSIMRAQSNPESVVTREKIQREHATIAQLPASPELSPEKVVEEVVKRIEAQKAEAALKNR
ncbi:MAG: hypothetical protein A2079_04000 [Geobacteraceae bacterium GWC2_48_7]|nr:MAG: hypothetical protein A2079_04000 [Geobacteraceae bacterium GWC2_48_7]